LSSSASQRRARGRGGWIVGGLCALALGAFAPAGAGGGDTQTGAFAESEPSARGAALAGALAPLVDDPTAVYWNPARLAEVETRGIAAGYADLFGLHLVRQAAFFVAWPRHERSLVWERGTLSTTTRQSHTAWGLGLQSKQIDLDPESYAEYDVALAHARRGPLGLDWGFVFHLLMVRSDLADVSATGFAGDLAIARAIGPRIDGALVLRSLVSDLSWKASGREPLTRTVEAGIGARLGRLRVPATVAVDLDAGTLRQVAAGAEWSPIGSTLTLRGGLRWRDDGDGAEVRAAGGFGLHWKEVAFDYGLSMGPSELGETHRFGLQFGF